MADDMSTTTTQYRDYLQRKKDQLNPEPDAEEEDRRLPMDQRLGDLDLGETEQATLDTPIANTNVGFKLLQKMGWREGTGLGVQGTGRVEPVRIDKQMGFLGLGKWTYEVDMAADATESRRKLDVEIEETEEMRLKRFEKTQRQEAIHTEIKNAIKVFLCEVCDKQYTKVPDWENHLSSYDHHHRKRLKDLAQREKARSLAGNSRKKDQRKLEKEMARLSQFASAQQQHQGPATQPPSTGAPPPPPTHQPPPPPPPSTDPSAHSGNPPPPPLPVQNTAPPPPPPTQPDSDTSRPVVAFGIGKKQQTVRPIKFAFGASKPS